MTKVLVCIEDGMLRIRINRILTDKRIPFDIVKTPIRKDDLTRYQFLIIHSSYKISGLYQFIESLLVNQTIPIIFISMNSMSSILHRFQNNPFFVQIDEVKMDGELPLAITLFQKQTLKLESLIEENKALKTKLNTEQAMSKCKKLLMSEGLSEEEAHQLILKTAMDFKISKFDACIKIINEFK
ncbi:MAG: hypothetical protein PHC62_07205 [Candidatus Izemoplasmatales bacterium]|jgi:hypothetical protein|nr:hypothetical protein [Candidatus Izemoplasmatales bacterium]